MHYCRLLSSFPMANKGDGNAAASLLSSSDGEDICAKENASSHKTRVNVKASDSGNAASFLSSSDDTSTDCHEKLQLDNAMKRKTYDRTKTTRRRRSHANAAHKRSAHMHAPIPLTHSHMGEEGQTQQRCCDVIPQQRLRFSCRRG